jgi:hypothetical protein
VLYPFPTGTRAVAVKAYRAPYADPIRVRAGDAVAVDAATSASTDVVGWLWCRGPDGREGWTPETWLDRSTEPPRLVRDYDAIELNVVPGDEVALLFAESGFVRCRLGERVGWLPDGVLRLVVDGGEPADPCNAMAGR